MSAPTLRDRAREIAAAPFAYASADITAVIGELLAEIEAKAAAPALKGMIEKKCKRCKTPMMVRRADHNRGWGIFCSKACKASDQERRTGQHAAFKAAMVERDRQADHDYAMGAIEAGWDGHKNA